jgi:hypothetical protein
LRSDLAFRGREQALGGWGVWLTAFAFFSRLQRGGQSPPYGSAGRTGFFSGCKPLKLVFFVLLSFFQKKVRKFLSFLYFVNFLQKVS